LSESLAGEWMDVLIPFKDLIPVVRTQTIPVSQRRAFQGASILSNPRRRSSPAGTTGSFGASARER
jgi:hypothetical protein